MKRQLHVECVLFYIFEINISNYLKIYSYVDILMVDHIV